MSCLTRSFQHQDPKRSEVIPICMAYHGDTKTATAHQRSERGTYGPCKVSVCACVCVYVCVCKGMHACMHRPVCRPIQFYIDYVCIRTYMYACSLCVFACMT